MITENEQSEAQILAAIVRRYATATDLETIQVYGRCLLAGTEPPLKTTGKFIPALYRAIPPTMRLRLSRSPAAGEFENAIALKIVGKVEA